MEPPGAIPSVSGAGPPTAADALADHLIARGDDVASPMPARRATATWCLPRSSKTAPFAPPPRPAASLRTADPPGERRLALRRRLSRAAHRRGRRQLGRGRRARQRPGAELRARQATPALAQHRAWVRDGTSPSTWRPHVDGVRDEEPTARRRGPRLTQLGDGRAPGAPRRPRCRARRVLAAALTSTAALGRAAGHRPIPR